MVGGGVIPEEDIPLLKAQGVKEIFTPGTGTLAVVEYIKKHALPR